MENTLKILIIEDDVLISGMYAVKLGKEGFKIDSAKTGKEAIEKLQKNEYDLVLLDKALPDIDGFEILKHIKTNQKLKDRTKVIVLTNVSEKNDAQNAMDLGAEDYLVKANFTPAEIVEKIKNTLKPKIY